ncbi:MAG: hypothetical protein QOH06_5308 [Acidobacteriota bacterium]|nr:hypothetical protein [Acidobacteriota bacterium]
MVSMKSGFGILGGFALLFILTAAPAAASLKCLPTCDVTDGRFLAIAGTGFDTLSPPELALSIAVPAGSTSFDLSVFDGDGGEYDPFGDANWDAGLTALFSYSLYADPNANGTGLIPVNLMPPGSPTVLSSDLPDNQWADFTVSTGPAALSPSGNYFYVLKVRLEDPTLETVNSFKVRTSAVLSGMTLDPVERPFSYIAPWTALTDLAIVYPNYPDPLPTTYDGTFRFFFDVPVSQSQIVLWDGDFDHGKFNLTEQDTNDPDTPGFPFVPTWATLDTLPEGVAIGGLGTGSPADDASAAGFGAYILREPSVRYELTTPGGTVLANENPSGNKEWERFAISTAPFDPSQMDYSVPNIPPGVYKLEVLGVDMLNLNALLLPFRVLCVEETGEPCTPLRPYLLGDTVFLDADGDGSQDPGEPGIAGVLLELYDSLGTLLASTTTDSDGHYSFGVEREEYEVRVAASNFSGPLAGTASTTGGDSRERTVTTGNNALDVDFGYRGTGRVGDRVWNDLDGNGAEDGGEPGLVNVTLQLLDGSGNVIAMTATDSNGNYTFTNLTPGAYSVRVMTSTLPAGATPTHDFDGAGSAHIATFTLTAGQNRADIDFGYRPTPTTCTTGTFKDTLTTASFSNNDGTLSWSGSWVESDVAGAGVSSGNVTVGTPVSGYMIFRDSPDTGTQPSAARQANLAGYAAATLTVDFHIRGVEPDDAAVIEVSNNDGTSYTVLETLTGYTGTYISSRTFNISAYMASNTRVRFRISSLYGGDDDFFKIDQVRIEASCTPLPQTGSAGNRVWSDTDGDGVPESGEPGLNSVTVQLLNSGGTVIATQATSGDGNYLFSGLAAGTYKVNVVSSTVPSGSTPSYDFDGTGTAHIATFTLTAGQNRTDIDFGYRPAPVCTAGTFKDTFTTASFSNNEGTLGWSGSWVESDVAGAGASSGNVTVGTPVSGYMIFRDSPDTGTQPSAARQANLSGFASATLTVDFHIRGVEPDDAAVIEVSNNGGSSYTVLETLTGYTGTYISSRTFNISAYMASNTRIRFRISSLYGGDDDFFKIDQVRIDASCTPAPTTGSAGNRVWKDLDGDGIQDSGEPGLNGITVQLLNSGGTVIATQTTSGDGNYLIGGLAAGTYKVKVVSSTVPSGSTPTYDLDGTGTAHTATVTLAAGQNRTDVDFGYRPAPTCTAGYFKDTLTTAGFSNNEGTLSWSAAWVESDTAGTGVSSGNVTVGIPVSGYMIFRDSPDTGTQPSAARQANLSGFASATLTVSFHIRGVETDDEAVIEVSNNGGSSYTVLETLTGYTGTYISSRTYNISAYKASNTRIRFRIKSNYGGSDDFFKVDWVKIDAACQ